MERQESQQTRAGPVVVRDVLDEGADLVAVDLTVGRTRLRRGDMANDFLHLILRAKVQVPSASLKAVRTPQSERARKCHSCGA